MIRDALNTFGTDIDITLATGTHKLGEALDFGSGHDRELGTGTPPKRIGFIVTQADVDSAGDGATLAFVVTTSANEDLSSGTDLVTSQAYAEADLVKGKYVELTLPEGEAVDRYLGVQGVIGGEAITTGTVTAWVVQ